MEDIKYKLDPIDYISFQLFSIHLSEKVQSKIRKNKIIIPVIYTIFAIVFYILSNILLGSLFVILSILWYIFYPDFQKRRYRKYYTRYIHNNYSTQFEASSNIIIDEEFAYLNSKKDKVKIKLSEISGVNKIKTHLFLTFNSGNTLIIPKEKVKDFNKLQQHIKKIIEPNSIEFKVDHDWQIKK